MNLCSRSLRGPIPFRIAASACVHPPHCRNLFILHSVKNPERTTPIKKKIEAFRNVERVFDKKTGPAAEQAFRESKKIELWKDNPRELIGEFTLEEVRTTQLRPGYALAPWNEKYVSKIPKYLLAKITKMPKEMLPRKKKHKQKRSGKIMIFRTAMDSEQFIDQLSESYKHIELGFKVEFHIYATYADGRRVIQKLLLQRNRKLKMNNELVVSKFGMSQFNWYDEAYLQYLDLGLGTRDMFHLQPDLILASMPAKSGYVIESRGDWKEYTFAIGPPDPTLQRVVNLTDEFDQIMSAYKPVPFSPEEGEQLKESKRAARRAMREALEATRQERRFEKRVEKAEKIREKKARKEIKKAEKVQKRFEKLKLLNEPAPIVPEPGELPNLATPTPIEDPNRRFKQQLPEIPVRRVWTGPIDLKSPRNEMNVYRPVINSIIEQERLPLSAEVGYKSLRNSLNSRISAKPLKNQQSNSWWT